MPVFKVLQPLTPGDNIEAQVSSAEEREEGTPGEGPGVDEVKSTEVWLGSLSGWPGHVRHPFVVPFVVPFVWPPAGPACPSAALSFPVPASPAISHTAAASTSSGI